MILETNTRDIGDFMHAFYLSDNDLKEQVELLRENMTPEKTLNLINDIIDSTPDIEAVDVPYRIAYIAKEAYILGAVTALDSYREAVKQTLEEQKNGGTD